MNRSNQDAETWIRRLFGRRHADHKREFSRVEPRVSFPMLLSAGKDEHVWEPIWNEMVTGAVSLGLQHAQLEVRSERGFHTFQYEAAESSHPSNSLMWEATACLYAGSKLMGRMLFVGHHSSDLSLPFEQLAQIVNRTEELVPDQLKQIGLPFSNEIRLASVA